MPEDEKNVTIVTRPIQVICVFNTTLKQHILYLQEGATILVTGKDEEAWWKGECNGKTGVFPSNYVEAAKCKYLLMQCALMGP